jgi:hypothetical protein
MKIKLWLGIGFGIDKKMNRFLEEEKYLVFLFLKIRISTTQHVFY